MRVIEKYECPKCKCTFFYSKGGIIADLSEPICTKCGYKLSSIEQLKYKRLPIPNILKRIFS